MSLMDKINPALKMEGLKALNQENQTKNTQ